MPATSVRCSVPTSTVSLSSLLRLRHPLGRQHLRHPQLDLHEVVDRDPLVRRRLRCGRGRGCGAAGWALAAAGGAVARCVWSVSSTVCSSATAGLCGLDGAGRLDTRPQRVALDERALAVRRASAHRRAAASPAGVASRPSAAGSPRPSRASSAAAAPRRRAPPRPTSNSTCVSRSACAGSRASAHGSVLAMYSLVASTSGRPRQRLRAARSASIAAR